MASLIPDSEKAALRQAYEDFFDTFKKKIVVHRQPKKIISQINLGFLYGYGDDANYQVGDGPNTNTPSNYAYEPQSSTFYGIVWYPKKANQDLEIGGDIRAFNPDGEVRIKVDKTARDYMVEGPNVERVDILDHSYSLVSEDAEINQLFTGYYVFKLKEIS